MLLDPTTYKQTIQNLTLEELYEERKMLIKEIKRYEKNKKELDNELVHPSPELVHQMNLEYLEVVRELILDKIEYR